MKILIKKYFVIFAILVPAFCFAATQQHESPAQKQKVILTHFKNYLLQHRKSPYGVTAFSAVAQCKSNAPIVVYGGTTDSKGNVPINQNGLFQIGSVTKSFISVVMLQVAQEYKINLDSHKVISKYFPQYPKWGNITVRQLLNMTSGIPATGGDPNDVFAKFTAHEYHNYISPMQILNLKYQLPMKFKSGTQFEYTNANYTLLGMLIQKITHHSAQYEVKKRIFDKLNLHHTYFPENKLQTMPGINQSNIVHGYSYYPNHPENIHMKFGQDTVNFSLSENNFAGAIVSTPSDINRYIHALYTPGVLLTEKQLIEFTTSNGFPFPKIKTDKVGYGLGVFGYYSKKLNSMVYWYQGETDGFQFWYFYNPKSQQYVSYGYNTIANIITWNDATKLFYQLNKYCKN